MEEVLVHPDTLLQNLGIECYLSDHERVSGKYKQTSEDFCVTELDVNGRLVSLEDSTSCLEDVSGNKSAKCVKLSDDRDNNLVKVTGKDESATMQRMKDTWQIPDLSGHPFSMEDYIDQNTCMMLGKFSLHHKNNHGNKCDCYQDNPAWDGEHLSLGVFESKELRCKIHQCVKRLHPHLKTSTNRRHDQALGSEIVVTPDPVYQEFRSLFDAEDVDKLMLFVDTKDCNASLQLTAGESKEKRTAIHRLLAKHFGTMVESKTFVGSSKGRNQTNEKTTISVRFREKFKHKAKKRKASGDEQADLTVYTAFTVKKKDIETLDAIQQIAMATDSQASCISYAGTKDKKAVTTQGMVIKGVTPSRLQQIQGMLRNITIGNIHQCSEPLQLGNLAGNRFDIIIRDVRKHSQSFPRDVKIHTQSHPSATELQELISTAVTNVQERGFVNYYGTQRFGALESPGTADRVGLALLKGKMRDAVDLILLAGQGEDPVNTAKRHWHTTRNAKQSLQMMPKFKSRECMILKALHRHGQDEDGFIKALMAIPHSMRIMYVHSYCSLVWNRMATYRVKTHGCRVIQGDLVEVHEGDGKTKIHAITEEDILAETYTIQDVVLPLPGNSVTMPTNHLSERYHQLLESDGIRLDQFRVPCLKLNIPGDYRKLVAWPQNLSWELMQGVDKHADGGDEKLGTDMPTEHQTEFAEKNKERCSAAIKLSFILQPSSYATVFLREILDVPSD